MAMLVSRPAPVFELNQLLKWCSLKFHERFEKMERSGVDGDPNAKGYPEICSGVSTQITINSLFTVFDEKVNGFQKAQIQFVFVGQKKCKSTPRAIFSSVGSCSVVFSRTRFFCRP